MSKHLTFIGKVKLFMRYLRHQKDGVIVDCPYCKSIDIKFDNQLEHEIDDRKIYSSKYKCNNCGATCSNKQEWFKAPHTKVKN